MPVEAARGSLTRMTERLQRMLAFHGAALFAAGMVYGLIVGATMLGWVPGDPGMALGSHLNALLGAIWLLGMGWSFPFGSWTERVAKIAVGSTILAAWANWLVSALKALGGHTAIFYKGEVVNDLLFLARAVFVIVPSLVGPALWAHAMWKGARVTRGPNER